MITTKKSMVRLEPKLILINIPYPSYLSDLTRLMSNIIYMFASYECMTNCLAHNLKEKKMADSRCYLFRSKARNRSSNLITNIRSVPVGWIYTILTWLISHAQITSNDWWLAHDSNIVSLYRSCVMQNEYIRFLCCCTLDVQKHFLQLHQTVKAIHN
jgi:hypothetical protein